MNEDVNQYQERTITFDSYNTNGFPTEGGGMINGAFKVKGYARIYKIHSNIWMLSVGAVAEIVNVTQGTVDIRGSVTMFVNGSRHDEKSMQRTGYSLHLPCDYDLGVATFALPAKGRVEINTNVSYFVDIPGGGAVGSNLIKDFKYALSRIKKEIIGKAQITIYP